MTETTLDVVIPRIWASEALKRYGIEPTEANIDAYLEAGRKAAEEEAKYCHECGRDFEEVE